MNEYTINPTTELEALRLVKQIPAQFRNIPDSLKTESVCIAAIRQQALNAFYLPSSMRTNRVLLELVKINTEFFLDNMEDEHEIESFLESIHPGLYGIYAISRDAHAPGSKPSQALFDYLDTYGINIDKQIEPDAFLEVQF